MEFDGFGTLQPVRNPSELSIRSHREIEGGWFISGPALVEEMEDLKRRHL